MDTKALRKVVPPLWLAFFLTLGLLTHFVIPGARVFDLTPPLPWLIIGIAVFLSGFYVPLWASKIFAEEKTEILPNSPANRVLITRGPFRFSRNPMYLGMVLMLLGIALAVGTLPMFLSALAHFLVMNFLFVPFEEEKMARQFGDAFQAYTQRVRRWL